MNKTVISSVVACFLMFGLNACKKVGCTDPAALNYDANSVDDDGSCVYLSDNLTVKFHSKLGTENFAYDSDALTASGRKVRIINAQMYMSGFALNGQNGELILDDSYLLVRPETVSYNLGYAPLGTYSTVSFSVGVDSAANHEDPAVWESDNPLSSNNPYHMHWGWNTGFIFFAVEGYVDTSATMNGATNAPFSFHIGLDKNLVRLAFVDEISVTTEGAIIELDIDWLKLFNGTNMTSEIPTRSTDSFNNPDLATLVRLNVDDAFRLH